MSDHNQKSTITSADTRELMAPIRRVTEIVGLSKTTIYRMIPENAFPKPVMVRGRALWPISRIQEWVRQQVEAHPDSNFDKAA